MDGWIQSCLRWIQSCLCSAARRRHLEIRRRSSQSRSVPGDVAQVPLWFPLNDLGILSLISLAC